MVDVVHMKGGGSPGTPRMLPPPPGSDQAAKLVDRTLLAGRKRRLGYKQTILGGGDQEDTLG
jgi:hypothetical protein